MRTGAWPENKEDECFVERMKRVFQGGMEF